MFKPSGNLFYKDDYDTFYRVVWSTVGSSIDISTVVMQPYVWGARRDGYVKDGILYRLGVITVIRQIIKVISGGYEIVADGSSQYTDYVQMNYPCGGGPVDTFMHHLDYIVSDNTESRIVDGSNWSDPDDLVNTAVWCDVDEFGECSSSATETTLSWTDVWTN